MSGLTFWKMAFRTSNSPPPPPKLPKVVGGGVQVDISEMSSGQEIPRMAMVSAFICSVFMPGFPPSRATGVPKAVGVGLC